MNIFGRAICSIRRRFGKTAILFLVVFVLGNIIAGSVAMKEASSNVEEAMKNQLGAMVKLDLDYQKATDGTSFISIDDIKKMEEHPSVASSQYTAEVGMVSSEKLTPYASDSDDNMMMQGALEGEDFTLVGTSNSKISDFEQNKKTIVDGRMLEEEDFTANKNVTLISQELAIKNNLKVGDHIPFQAVAITQGDGSNRFNVAGKTTFELEVVGIFKTNELSKEQDNMPSFIQDMEKNKLFTTTNVADEVDDQLAEIYQATLGGEKELYLGLRTPTFTLKSVDQIEEFSAFAKEIAGNGYKVTSSADSFTAVAGSIENMKDLSTIVLYVGTLASIVILALILVTFLRERKQEFGLYKALGERSIVTITQVLLEVVVITTLAVTLALFSGNKLAESVSETMIENQMRTSTQNEQDQMFIVGGGATLPTIDEEDIKENYKISFDENYIMMFYGIMIGTTLVATIFPAAYVLRLRPKKILL